MFILYCQVTVMYFYIKKKSIFDSNRNLPGGYTVETGVQKSLSLRRSSGEMGGIYIERKKPEVAKELKSDVILPFLLFFYPRPGVWST